MCNYKYCFQDVMIKWPGIVQNLWSFFKYSADNIRRNETISSCGKVDWDGTDPIPVFVIGDPVCPSLSFSRSNFRVVAKNQEKRSSAKNDLVKVLHLVHWKPVLDACNMLWFWTRSCVVMKNGQTFFENLAVFTAQNF